MATKRCTSDWSRSVRGEVQSMHEVFALADFECAFSGRDDSQHSPARFTPVCRLLSSVRELAKA
jgi:hypothetical protein